MEREKKELQKILSQQRKEYQEYLGALYDKFQKDLTIVAEGVLSLQEKMVRVEKSIAEIKEEIMLIKMDINFIKSELKKFVRVEEFEALEKRVGLLERKVAR